jgi:hypothetical protein
MVYCMGGIDHDKDGVPIVESRVGNPAAQLTSLLAEGARVAEVVGSKVTDSLYSRCSRLSSSSTRLPQHPHCLVKASK